VVCMRIQRTAHTVKGGGRKPSLTRVSPLTAANEPPDCLTPNPNKYPRVHGDEWATVYSAFVEAHQCDLFKEPEQLHEWMRLLHGRCREIDAITMVIQSFMR
jgi:hypothetical protein